MLEKIKKLLKNKYFYILAVAVVLIIVSVIFLAEPIYNTPDYSDFKTESTQSEAEENTSPVDFNALKAQNKDAFGWIHIPGSEKVYGHAIDYPLLQSGNDKAEDFYLNADLYGKKSKNGSIYIQKYNSKYFTDKNTIVYGHNLYNKQMFTALHKFLNREFFDENQYIYIYLPDKTLKYRVFSAFVHSDMHLLYEYDFNKESDYDSFLAECKAPKSKKGLSRKDVTVTNQDRIVTLSTCTSKEKERLLVVGVLIEEQTNIQ